MCSLGVNTLVRRRKKEDRGSFLQLLETLGRQKATHRLSDSLCEPWGEQGGPCSLVRDDTEPRTGLGHLVSVEE